MNGVVNISGGVVRHLGAHAGRQFFFDLIQFDADALDHVEQELAFGSTQIPMNTAFWPEKRTSVL